jgi:hypothetical protein
LIWSSFSVFALFGCRRQLDSKHSFHSLEKLL